MLIDTEKTQVVHLSLWEPKYIPFFTTNGKQLTTKHVTFQTIRGHYRHKAQLLTKEFCEGLARQIYGMWELKRLGLNSKGVTMYFGQFWLMHVQCGATWTPISTKRQSIAMRIINSDISYGHFLSVPVDQFIADLPRKTVLNTIGVAQWLSSCLSFGRPCVQFLAAPN